MVNEFKVKLPSKSESSSSKSEKDSEIGAAFWLPTRKIQTVLVKFVETVTITFRPSAPDTYHLSVFTQSSLFTCDC